MRRVLIISTFFAYYSFAITWGAIINVPGDCPTIQLGIDISIDGDTVLVQPGTYVENINFNGHNILLGSLFLTTGDSSYIWQTVIDGDSAGSVVIFESGEDNTTLITGFSIQNGFVAFGGGGGGIRCSSSNPVISDNIIHNNNANDMGCWGGGIYASNSDLQIIQNIIYGNLGRGGGGIFCIDSPNPLIYGNVINNNSSIAGGGIYCWNSNPNISSNEITYNTAIDVAWSSGGGGIFCRESNPIIKGNVISENMAYDSNGGGFGGGIALEESSPVISNNIICENLAPPGNRLGGGGGIGCSALSTPLILNNVIFGNFAGCGGGFCSWISTSVLTNNIFWSDSSSYGSEIWCDTSSNMSITFCNIQDTLWPGNGNISIDPFFRDLDNDNYHLMSTACGDSVDSPCIDAGDTNILDSLLDCSWGLGEPRSDMGAFGGGDSILTSVFEIFSLPPERYLLLNNYPNPFNVSTTIIYSLPEATDVRIEIYDILGRHLQTLLDDYRQAGFNSVTFDASRLSSGIYFYRLTSGCYIVNKKMGLIK